MANQRENTQLSFTVLQYAPLKSWEQAVVRVGMVEWMRDEACEMWNIYPGIYTIGGPRADDELGAPTRERHSTEDPEGEMAIYKLDSI